MESNKKEENTSKRNEVPFACVDKGTFSERLVEVMGISKGREFAKKCGVSYSTLHNYITGESLPKLDKLILLADTSGVDLRWLATGKGDKYQNDSPISSHTSNSLEDFVLIPGYSVQVSAGHGSAGSDEQVPSRYLAFRKKWLSYRGFKEEDLIALWAKGDSMEPIIDDNNTLIIHTSETKPVDGNIYVLRLEDQLWVKRVQVTPFGGCLLLSDNNSIYPPIEIKKEDMEQFDVIGKVVHIAKDV